MPDSSLTVQICHPERSAWNIFPDESDRRGVEGSQEYFDLRNRFNAFSREFPVAACALKYPRDVSTRARWRSHSLNMTGLKSLIKKKSALVNQSPTPRSLVYRMPAEWEPHQSTWL